jgi:hypothetical protein
MDYKTRAKHARKRAKQLRGQKKPPNLRRHYDTHSTVDTASYTGVGGGTKQ